MQVRTIGDGEPELAVVGGVHGDEPCGVTAIREIFASDPPLERPTAFIVANERALERGVRYVDVDLNRVMPGEADADEYERRLAAELADVVEGCDSD
jgi:succinylglutamate desuccinylase